MYIKQCYLDCFNIILKYRWEMVIYFYVDVLYMCMVHMYMCTCICVCVCTCMHSCVWGGAGTRRKDEYPLL